MPLAQVIRLTNDLASRRRPSCAIEDVEEPVSIGMQQEFPILPAKFGVHQNDGRVRIPIVRIVRSELVVPFQFAGGRIERQDAIREQVVAAAFAIV